MTLDNFEWLRMTYADLKWLSMTWNNLKWLNWLKMTLNDSKWLRMTSNDSKWLGMTQNVFNWLKMTNEVRKQNYFDQVQERWNRLWFEPASTLNSSGGEFFSERVSIWTLWSKTKRSLSTLIKHHIFGALLSPTWACSSRRVWQQGQHL